MTGREVRVKIRPVHPEPELTPHQKLGVAILHGALIDGDVEWVYGERDGLIPCAEVCAGVGVDVTLLRERFPQALEAEIRREQRRASEAPGRGKKLRKRIREILRPAVGRARCARATCR